MAKAYNILMMVGIVFFMSVQCSEAEENKFWDTWGDAQAEVSVYDLVQKRYGELRRGEAVLIFVAEPHTRKTRVKPDPGNHPKKDIFYVLKLNHLRTFQTGVYPYRIMSSIFTQVDPEGDRPRGSPSKVTFSSQEWCGQVFHQLRFDQKSLQSNSFSYFDKEADQSVRLPYPPNALVGDNLYVALRGILGVRIKPGERKSFDFLPTLAEVRLDHKPLAWSKARVHRAALQTNIDVPAGRYGVDLFTLTSAGRPTLKFWIESGPPHRVIAWEGSDGEKAELKGSERMKYWQLNKKVHESRLKDLGIR